MCVLCVMILKCDFEHSYPISLSDGAHLPDLFCYTPLDTGLHRSQSAPCLAWAGSLLGATMSYIRCLSKRKMIRGMDGYVMRLMAGVKTRVYEQPGLLSYKILVGKRRDFHVFSGYLYHRHAVCYGRAEGG